MASYTEKLNLLKKNPVTDGADTFNIETMMNENWDKIDGFSAFLEASIAPPYSASSAYAVGAWCTHYGKLYQCTTAIGSGGEAWNAGHWTAKSTAELIAAVKAAIPSAYTSSPAMNGTASAGSSTKWARGDHVHPKDTSKADQSLLATYVRPNLLANWYFVGGGSQAGMGKFPVNQRGSATYSPNYGQYTIDRWYYRVRTGCSLTIEANDLMLTSGGSGFQGIIQSVENGVATLAGKTVTLSVLVTQNNLSSAQLTLSNSSSSSAVGTEISHTTVTGTGIFSFTAAIPSSLSNDYLNVTLSFSQDAANKTIKIVAMKLEVGSTQTLAHKESGVWVLNEIPTFKEQLEKCQYCGVELNPFGGNYAGVGQGHATSATNANIIAPLPVTMRAKPVVTLAGSWVLEPGHKSVTNVEVDYIEGNSVRLKATSSGLSQGSFYALEAYNDSSARIFLSADY